VFYIETFTFCICFLVKLSDHCYCTMCRQGNIMCLQNIMFDYTIIIQTLESNLRSEYICVKWRKWIFIMLPVGSYIRINYEKNDCNLKLIHGVMEVWKLTEKGVITVTVIVKRRYFCSTVLPLSLSCVPYFFKQNWWRLFNAFE